MKIRLFINVTSIVMFLFSACLLFAQETERSAHGVDCSIPTELKKSRPHPEGTPTEVSIGVLFLDIKAISDRKQSFTADGFFISRWNDPRLSQTSLGKSLEYCHIALDKIWHPDLISVNMIKGTKLSAALVDVDKAGNVIHRQQWRNTEFYSDFNFRDFPFDNQILHVVLIQYEHARDDITFTIDGKYTGMLEYLSEEGWDIEIIEPKISSEYLAVQNRHMDRIDFRLSAERQAYHYLWKIIVPLGLIVLMAWSVFWIDPSQIGPQIGLSTATIFTLIAFRFSLGFLVPPVAYFTRIDKYVFLCTLLVFLALGTSVITARFAFEDKRDLAQKTERWLRAVYLIFFAIIILYSFVL